MKKLILSVTALAACSVGAYAQGVVYFTSPVGAISINGQLDTATDINAELLTSATASGTFTPVAQLLLSSSNTSSDHAIGFDSSDIVSATGDITAKHTGTLAEQGGNAFAVNGTSSAFFIVEAWLGSSSTYDTTVAHGATAAFSQVLGNAQSPTPQTLTSMPALNLATTVVPEPSTLAMAGVGLASMLIFRRRK